MNSPVNTVAINSLQRFPDFAGGTNFVILAIVTLAFFLRYPNPYASHVLSCDVISRSVTPSGSLITTRLILKRGAMPRWFPQGIVSRAETWVVEETEVDPVGRTVRCKTRNLDHVKIMQVEETVVFKSAPEG